tara:strand:- start:1589 stop:2311 length:723 start_codon:yes stop_codon:yes gene_type:complete
MPLNKYDPAIPTSSSAFSADDVADAFKDLSLWSNNVGDWHSGAQNIPNNGKLGAEAFRPGSASKVWTSGSTDPDSYLCYQELKAGGSVPFADYTYYDIPGASVNFYLREAVSTGRLKISSTVNFWKAREFDYFNASNNVTAATFQFELTGYLNNSTADLVPVNNTNDYAYGIGSSGTFTRRGMNLVWSSSNNKTLAAGLYRFKLRLSFAQTRSVGSPADYYAFNHIKGSGARTTVTAIYK